MEDKKLNLEDIISLILEKKRTILLITLSIALVIISFSRISTKNYKATSTILIEEKNKSMTSILDIGFKSQENFLRNEIEIIKSNEVSQKTLARILDSDNGDGYVTFLTKKNNYTPIGFLARKVLMRDMSTYTSETLPDSLYYELAKNLQKNISVLNPRETDVLKISVSAKRPKEAATITNTLIEVYKEIDQMWITNEMRYLESFLVSQLSEKQKELNEIEEKLKNFQKENEFYGISENASLLLEQLTNIESEYYLAEAEANILSKRKEFYQDQLSTDEINLANNITNTTNTRLSILRNELAILESEYVSTKAKKGLDHPALIELDEKINALRNSIELESIKYINQGVSTSDPLLFRQAIMDSLIQVGVTEFGLRSKQRELENVIENYNGKLNELPELTVLFSRYERDKVILDQTYKVMKTKLEEAKIQKASQVGKVRVIDIAEIPKKSTSPSIFIIFLFANIIGLTAGISYVFIVNIFDNSIKSLDDIEKIGLSILAIIPKFKNPNTSRAKLIMEDKPKSALAESIRSLRTSLSLQKKENQEVSRSIMITSTIPGEGKSTLASNLAISYALSSKKVLLIDADMRKPVIHKIFKFEDNDKGLSTILSSNAKTLKDVFFKTKYNNLDIIKSGPIPPNPSELLSSSILKELLEEAKNEYDYIIIDTPPIVSVTDSTIVASSVNENILIIKQSKADKKLISRATQIFEQLNIKFTGAVINAVSSNSSSYYGYYYSYKYYGSDDEK